jgi:hypothetical protein
MISVAKVFSPHYFGSFHFKKVIMELHNPKPFSTASPTPPQKPTLNTISQKSATKCQNKYHFSTINSE